MYVTYPVAGEVVAATDEIEARKAVLKARKSALGEEKADYRMTGKEMAQTRREITQAKKTYAQSKQAARLDTRKSKIERKTGRDLAASPPPAASRTTDLPLDDLDTSAPAQKNAFRSSRWEAAPAAPPARPVIPPDPTLPDAPSTPPATMQAFGRLAVRANQYSGPPSRSWFADREAQAAATAIWNASKIIQSNDKFVIVAQAAMNGQNFGYMAGSLLSNDVNAIETIVDTVNIAIGAPPGVRETSALGVLAARFEQGAIDRTALGLFWGDQQRSFPNVDFKMTARGYEYTDPGLAAAAGLGAAAGVVAVGSMWGWGAAAALGAGAWLLSRGRRAEPEAPPAPPPAAPAPAPAPAPAAAAPQAPLAPGASPALGNLARAIWAASALADRDAGSVRFASGATFRVPGPMTPEDAASLVSAAKSKTQAPVWIYAERPRNATATLVTISIVKRAGRQDALIGTANVKRAVSSGLVVVGNIAEVGCWRY